MGGHDSVLDNFKAAFRKKHLALGKAEPSPRGRSHRQMDLVSEQEGIWCPGRAYWTRRLHWGTAIAWAICQVGGDAGRRVSVKALSSQANVRQASQSKNTSTFAG